MARVRRPRYLGFACEDTPFLDIRLLLQGEVEPTSLTHVFALSVLTGEQVEVSAEELELVLSTPADRWVEPEDEETASELARKGVLLSEEDDDELTALRERDEQLERTGWHREGALYYFLTKWRGVDFRQLTGRTELSELVAQSEEAMRELIDRHGRPPPAFHSRESPAAVRDLPLVRRNGSFYDALERRRTVRSFDPETALRLDELAVLLYYVFGYHGYAPLAGEEIVLKRTSPSGGSLHPVEAYPLVVNVESVEPGLYHYNGHDHSLELIASLSADEAAALATELVCGQTYFGDAQVLFVLAARFDRAFWKYRNHPKAFGVVLMDAAHLSQTLYLVAAELGLGAFVTAAINNADIDEQLGLDGFREGTIAVCGCGKAAAEASPFDPSFLPFAPRETLI